MGSSHRTSTATAYTYDDNKQAVSACGWLPYIPRSTAPPDRWTARRACRKSCRPFDGRCALPFRQSVSSLFLPADGLLCSQYCKTSALCCSDKTLYRTVRRYASGTYARHSPPSVPPLLWLDVQHCSHAAALGFFRRFLLGFLSCFGNFLFGKREVKLPDEVIVDVHLLLSVRLLACGFVNNDFVNQLTRHLFCQLCGLLILLDEPDKPSDMSRGRFRLLQLLLNFRYLALKASCSAEYFFIRDLYCFSGSRPEMKFS